VNTDTELLRKLVAQIDDYKRRHQAGDPIPLIESEWNDMARAALFSRDALSRLLEAQAGQQMFIRNGQSGTGGTQDEGWLNISDLQKATGEFAERTFPKSTPQSVINHFKEESGEFAEAGDPEEAADCLLLLCHHAHKIGYSLLDEAAKKLRKNMKRKWETEPNAQGYFKHVDNDHPPSEGEK